MRNTLLATRALKQLAADRRALDRALAAMTATPLDELPDSVMTEILSPLGLARDALRAEAKAPTQARSARRERGPPDANAVRPTRTRSDRASMHGGSGAPFNLCLHACPIGDGGTGEIVLLFAPAEATADPAAMLATALIP
jgi:hypothetical protein